MPRKLPGDVGATLPRGQGGGGARAHIPASSVTFLMTDIEGSTRLWEAHPRSMARALARHDAIINETVQASGGTVIKSRGEGDSTFSVFATARSAVCAAIDLQRKLGKEHWPQGIRIRIRAALHTGQAEARGDDFFGLAVNKCARLRAIVHGGQTIVSRGTHDLVVECLPDGVALRDMGRHRLKDLSEAEAVFQLCYPELREDFPPLKSLGALQNNLPVQLTSFVGRAAEIAEVKARLTESRLVTLTGSGGCGKSRLALQVAADLLDDYPEGVWLVELAPIADPALVPQVIAEAMGIREDTGLARQRGAGSPKQGRVRITNRLIAQLAASRTLIILDNSEHLVDACAEIAQLLLGTCPGLTILATSREPLGVGGEVTLRVPSLAAPAAAAGLDHEAALGYDAIRLFVDRARLIEPQFQLSPATLTGVVAVCRRLDGIPLALELAAARLSTLTVDQIATRLNDLFHLLVGGRRAALSRHQTLKATIDWSFQLLHEPDQILFRRLSIFVGGFTLEAAEDICSDARLEHSEVLDLLAHLVNKSLVVRETSEAASRYRMLDTIRAYAREQLTEAEELVELRRRHREWCLALVGRAEPKLIGRDQSAGLALLEIEHDNLRAVLDWCIADGDADAVLRLVGGLWRFWFVRGYASEGRRWIEHALSLEQGRAVSMRIKALNGGGRLAYVQGDHTASRAWLSEALRLAREQGDKPGMAASLLFLGELTKDQGDHISARPLLEESLSLARQLDDLWTSGAALLYLGEAARDRRDYGEARTLLEEALGIARRMDYKQGIAVTLHFLAGVAIELGEYETARPLAEEALQLARELLFMWVMAGSMVNLARIERSQGKWEDALTLLDEALQIAQQSEARPQVARVLSGLADVLMEMGELDRATVLAKEALAVQEQVGDQRGIATSLEGLARLASGTGDADTALRLFGSADQLREELGISVPSGDIRAHERAQAVARSLVTPEVATRIWAEGRSMSTEDAVRLALTALPSATSPSSP